MDELSFRLESFEGPLDLLLKLITKQKIDIYDIPITVIFDQYMSYIDEMRRLDMDIAGEFITMAAELMLIKSKMLLPKPQLEETEDPRAALAAALAEYKRAKEASLVLSDRYALFSGRFTKDTDEIDIDTSFVSPHDVKLLEDAFLRILQHKKLTGASLSATPEQAVSEVISKRVTPVPERVFAIMRILLKQGKSTLETLLFAAETRSDLIASFAAILELVKNQRVIIEPFGEGEDDIYLSLRRRSA